MQPEFLHIRNGSARDRRVVLGETTDIGKRPTSELVLEDPGISWNHARIVRKNGKLWIADLDSTNGTFLDGQRIDRSWVRLKVGAELALARIEVRVLAGAEEQQPADEAPDSRSDQEESAEQPPTAAPWDAIGQEHDADHETERISLKLIESLQVEAEKPGPGPAARRALPGGSNVLAPGTRARRKTGEFAPPAFLQSEVQTHAETDQLAGLFDQHSAMRGAVLIVDEDDSFLYWAASVLKRAGYRITTADEGIEVLLTLVKRQRFSLILCGLPEARLEQLELFDNVRLQGLEAPVLFASRTAAAEELGERLGGRGFLRKPVSKEHLIEQVERHCLQPSAPMSTRTKALEKLERIDDFVIEQCLGQGGMGAVYLATQISLKRKVALKVLSPTRGEDAHAARMLSEARTAASLVHPNVVQIYTVGLQEKTGRPYFAMEYVTGRSLAEALEEGPLSFGRIFEVMLAVGLALERAAAKGIVHRDIKPGNIMLAATGEIKVLDFGLAKCTSAPDKLTATGVVLGSPVYMSPEQAGGKTLDVRSDLYSLGVVLYELLAGARPFHADTSAGMIFLHAFCQPRSICAVRRNVPQRLEKLLGRLLAKSPAERPSPEELVAELQSMRESLKSAGRLDALPHGSPVQPLSFAETQQGSLRGSFLTLGDQASGPRRSGLLLGAGFGLGLGLLFLVWWLLQR